MNWLTRLFGGESKKAEEAALELAAATPKTVAPVELARAFASQVPGAVLEDFLVDFREDQMVARVTYTYKNVESRLVIRWHRDGDGTTEAWLETRARGKLGYFDVRQAEPGEQFSDDTPRFFLSATCYLDGPRLRNEVARVLSLPESVRERLLSASAKVSLIGLTEEVMVAFLGDAFDFEALLGAKEKGAPFLVALGNELAFLGAQLPALCKETAELAEARTCRFCRGSFLFAPSNPGCTHCGAPAEGALPMPPPQFDEIPDDPLVAEEEEIERTMSELRDDLQTLLPLLEDAVVREEPERARIFVEYKLDGRAFRVKLKDHYAGVRVAAPGVRGDFYLAYRLKTADGEDSHHLWRESERRVFFSEHCAIRSDHTAKEVARLTSLPAEARARLLAMCEKYQAGAQLEAGYLAQGMDTYAHFEGMQHVVECSRELGAIADAIPRDYNDEEDQRYKLALCGFCRWEYFAARHCNTCSHCGAGAKSSAA